MRARAGRLVVIAAVATVLVPSTATSRPAAATPPVAAPDTYRAAYDPATTVCARPTARNVYPDYRYDPAASIPAPGVLSNDTGTGPLTAELVDPPDVAVRDFELGTDGHVHFLAKSPIGADHATFTYRAVGPGGASGPVTVTLTYEERGAQVCQTPIPVSDRYSTPRNRTLVVRTDRGVLSNDTDPLADLERSTLEASLTYEGAGTHLSTRHGTLDLRADGSLTYHPGRGFVGVDSFEYYAGNFDGWSDPATLVTITVGAPALHVLGQPAPPDPAEGATPVSGTASFTG